MSSIGDRISLIIEQNNLKKVQFANTLGITGAYVTHLVQGKNEPSEALIKLICEKFHINEEWLRTGEGEMKASMPAPPTDALDAVLDKYHLPRLFRGLFLRYGRLSEAAQQEVEQQILQWIVETAEQIKQSTETTKPKEMPDYSSETAEELTLEYYNAVKGAKSEGKKLAEELMKRKTIVAESTISESSSAS